MNLTPECILLSHLFHFIVPWQFPKHIRSCVFSELKVKSGELFACSVKNEQRIFEGPYIYGMVAMTFVENFRVVMLSAEL